MSDFPKSWIKCRLGDVLTLINGRAYKQEEMLGEGTPILRIQNLNGGSNWYYSSLSLPDDKYCKSGDLLYAWSATFGPYWWKGEKSIFHYHIWNVIPSEVIFKNFAYYELLRITDDIKMAAHGVAMPHITKGGMENWEIYLPPLNEQKRIADKLDQLLTRVDACRERLDRIPVFLKRFRQAVLAAATSGQLTEDWRSLRYPETFEWDEMVFGNIVVSAKTGLDRGSRDQGYDKRFSYFRMNNITTDGRICMDKLTRVNATPQELELFSLDDGDFIFNTRNSKELVGKSCVFKSDISCETMIYNNNILRVRFREQVKADFINYWFCSPAGRSELEKIKSATTNVAAIYQSKLMSLLVPLPSIEEQQEIIRRVEKLFTYADRLEARYRAARAQVDRLSPALLAKAFRGELTPQDPNDEPASALLERLRAERAAAPPKSRQPRGSSQTRPANPPDQAPRRPTQANSD